ncbi:hypothetical protein ACSBR1_001215 [Camellia fascicularis]
MTKEDYEEWVLNAVYASPNPIVRKSLWDDLEDTTKSMNKAWLVVGDFNDYANHSERRSFSPSQNLTQRFTKRVNNCNLLDLGSVGPRFTWTNNRQGIANTLERLGRAMSNEQWRALFPAGIVRTFPRTYSDHSPLIVYTQGMHPSTPQNRPFRFEVAWLCHPNFTEVVQKSWFKKRSLLACIVGIQKSQNNHFSHSLQLLEKDLIKQFNMTLFQEQILWYQKS